MEMPVVEVRKHGVWLLAKSVSGVTASLCLVLLHCDVD